MPATASPPPATFETPNATMRTHASPSLTGSPIAVWTVEMAPGASGPVHSASEEQVLVLLRGTLLACASGNERMLAPGESLLLRAGDERRLVNSGDEHAVAIVSSLPGATATVPGKDPVPIPWAR